MNANKLADFLRACDRWQTVSNSKFLFERFIGISINDFNFGGNLSDESIKRIDALNGPHGRTIVKAWLAKHGYLKHDWGNDST